MACELFLHPAHRHLVGASQPRPDRSLTASCAAHHDQSLWPSAVVARHETAANLDHQGPPRQAPADLRGHLVPGSMVTTWGPAMVLVTPDRPAAMITTGVPHMWACAEPVRAGRTGAGPPDVLDVPADDGRRIHHDPGVPGRALAHPQGPATEIQVGLAAGDDRHRRPGRRELRGLDLHRDGPSTVDRGWPVPDSGFGVALGVRGRRIDLTDRLHRAVRQ